MKGGQVVVVGWGLERKGGRGSEGERLDNEMGGWGRKGEGIEEQGVGVGG